MVKKLSDLYLDTRRALLDTEDPQSASLIARNILCRFTGKSQEQILADRDKYVTEETCEAVEGAIKRILEEEDLDDEECFDRIEKIVSVFEALGGGIYDRHDFG